MTDATTPDLPQPIADILAPEEFDVGSWLNEAAYPSEEVEIYNDGPVLHELTELVNQVQAYDSYMEEKSRKILAPISIADDDDDAPLLAAKILKARERILELRAQHAGTGVVYHFTGISTGERQLIRKDLAKSFRSSPYVAATEEAEAQPEIEGGENHPDFDDAFRNAIMARCFTKAVRSRDGATDSKPKSAEDFAATQGKLQPDEFSRLISAAFSVNYYSYDIETLVTTDFS